MLKFDLAVSYVWEYDVEFIQMIESMFHENGLTTFIISDYNVKNITEKLRNRELFFHCYLDRASDADDRFSDMAEMLSKRKTRIFNPYRSVAHAIDKANMHLDLITAGINTPYTIIIPPVTEKEEIYISINDLAILGRPFIIKPANTTGGGIGVVTGAESLHEVLAERISNVNDKYLIQKKIYPKELDGRRAWFRSFWAFGRPIPCWWNDQTHLYELLLPEHTEMYNLKELYSITRKIGKMTGLDFFSTEIVLTSDNKFVVVDYVNDQCDMRPQSNHYDGAPNAVIKQIIYNMAIAVKKTVNS
jgi:hypothetical protein